MEFFATAKVTVSEQELQQQVQIASLPRFCASIYEVLGDQGEQGEINTLWGVFRVHREAICGGVRFTLPGCPNAAAWTVTIDGDRPGEATVHCTINRRQHDADFIESLEAFVEDWREGLEARFTGVDTGAAARLA
ncbi:MAG TPA: hypothetical protein ENK40_01195 [Gammaproteobacteria bacterium]|nr:hypothetical protein [Gammaproteobacteria bacterium]